MNPRAALRCAFLFLSLAQLLAAQESSAPAPRHITLDEAVQLALKHNHVVRIAGYQVEEKQHAKDVARSAYFPVLRNDSDFLKLTDTQFIGIPAGSLGEIGGGPQPARTVVLNQ